MIFHHLHPETESNALQTTQPPIFMFLAEEKAYTKPSPMHAHEYTEIFYITSGKGKFMFSNTSVPFQENDVFIIPRYTAHQEVNISPKVRYLVVSVDNCYPFLDGVEPTLAPLYCSYPSDENELLRLIRRLRDELKTVAPYQEYTVNLLLSQIFVELLRKIPCEAPPPQQDPKNITAVYEYIREHCEEPITLHSLSKLYYSSSVQLGKDFRKVYGLTPIRFLTVSRIARAKQLLKTTKATISDIAISCGFSSPAYFAAVFIRETGMSPTDYRRKKHYHFSNPVPATPRR